jgi:nucleoside-diphosphate-sugar epimerase
VILLLGARGFVGSAFARVLDAHGVPFLPVTRESYSQSVGRTARVVINAAANSRKYLADTDWAADFDASVRRVADTLRDVRADLYVLVSSVDVYNHLDDPERNTEESPIDPLSLSRYGFHKYLAELCVRRHAPRWLIVRLAGMVGPGLKKNPVFDVVHAQPQRIHPDSQYQFMSTDAAARFTWQLIEAGWTNRVVNVCGAGLISPRQIAAIAGTPLVVSPDAQAAAPRVVDVNIALAQSVAPLPDTHATVAEFLARHRAPSNAI